MAGDLLKYNDLATEVNDLSGKVVDCAFQVHKELGAGFIEANYEEAFIIELKRKNLNFEQQKVQKILYKNEFLNYRLDY